MEKGQSVFIVGFLIFFTASFVALTDANASFNKESCNTDCKPVGSTCKECVQKRTVDGRAVAGGNTWDQNASIMCGIFATGTPTGSGSCNTCATGTSDPCGGLKVNTSGGCA